MRRLSLALIVLFARLGADGGQGCGPKEDVFEDDPAADCSLDMPDTEGLPTRTMEIGEPDADGNFVAWTEGQDVALVTGFQGASMITPYVELPAMADDATSECWYVRLQHLDEADEPTRDFSMGLVFDQTDTGMRTGPIFDIPEETYGDSIRVRITVSSDSFVAEDTVDIVLAGQ